MIVNIGRYILIVGIAFLHYASYAQSWQDSLRYGQELYNNGKYEEAYRTLMSAQRLAPEDKSFSKDIGNTAYRLGDFDIAERAYNSAIENSKNNVETSKYWHNIGNIQVRNKAYQEAIESYKKALRLDAKNEEARYNMALATKLLKKEEQTPKQQQKESQGENKTTENNLENQNSENSSDAIQEKKSSKEENKGGKLMDQKSEKVLDRLLKQEMETTEKIRKGEEAEKGIRAKSGKEW